jgi:hypothetical protein
VLRCPQRRFHRQEGAHEALSPLSTLVETSGEALADSENVAPESMLQVCATMVNIAALCDGSLNLFDSE